MKSKWVLIGLLIVLSGLALLSWGCGPRVVYVRPPEPRVEVYGPPPYPEAVWISGYWKYKGGDWVWVPGHWKGRPKPQAVWIPGHWEPVGGGWAWHRGHWEYR